MPLAKNVLQFVFGATDQDTSKKGVKAGDIIEARNVQQIKAGEHSKREGFTATAQTYEGLGSIVGESLASPDGVQVVTRDATTDTVFARSTDATHNKSQGASLRYLAKTDTRFPARETGTQIAPMAKQAGDFFVYLKNESTFVIAKRSPDRDTMLASVEYPISFGSPNPSTHVKSFAVLDDASFDATSLWIFWVDWSTNAGAQQYRDSIFAMKIDHATLARTYYTMLAGTDSNRCFTSIAATCTGDGKVTLGVAVAHRMDGADATFYDFRSDASRVDVGLCVVKFNTTPSLQFTSEVFRTSSVGGWTASGVCALTVAGKSVNHAGHCRFSFWAASTTHLERADLVVVDVNESNSNQTWTIAETVDNTGHLDGSGFTGRPYFVGQTTGREVAGGQYVVGSMRIYYHGATAGTWVDPADDVGLYPDRIYTNCWYVDDSTGPHLAWQKRGAWLAHGYFTADDGTDMLITGWQDGGELQVPYHLRRLDNGAILAQFAYGEGPFAGGCANDGTQIAGHINDINQPWQQARGATTANGLVLAIQSANVAGSADIASLTLEKPTYQCPAVFRKFALYPGPVPTIANGWQRLQEAGPLTFPSQLQTYFGTGSS